MNNYPTIEKTKHKLISFFFFYGVKTNEICISFLFGIVFLFMTWNGDIWAHCGLETGEPVSCIQHQITNHICEFRIILAFEPFIQNGPKGLLQQPHERSFTTKNHLQKLNFKGPPFLSWPGQLTLKLKISPKKSTRLKRLLDSTPYAPIKP